MSKLRATLAGASLLAVTACGGESLRAPSDDAQQAAFQQTYNYEGSHWPVECYDLQPVVAKSGDMLVRLMANNTDLVQPAALGRPDIPRAVYELAVADINHLPSPDEIQAGTTYQIPERCQPQG